MHNDTEHAKRISKYADEYLADQKRQEEQWNKECLVEAIKECMRLGDKRILH